MISPRVNQENSLPSATRRGMFIAVEGGDGAGKSTACAKLYRALLDRGYSCFKIDKRPEFTDPFLSDHVARLGALTWERGARVDRRVIDDDHWLHLAAAWYAVIDQHCVAPALAAHDFVLADSWYHKLLARFSLKTAEIGRRAALAFQPRTAPDQIFFLDVAPEVAARRKSEFGYAECGNFDGHSGCNPDAFVAYQTRVRRAYRSLISEPRWMVIGADDIGADAVVAVMLARVQANG